MGLNLQQSIDAESADHAEVQNIWVHPHYNSQTTQNDIGLIKLKKSVVVHASVYLDDGRHSEDKAMLTVAGWGNKRGSRVEKPALYPSNMHYLEVRRIPDRRCKRWMHDVHFNTMFCAGYKESGRDSCQ